MTALLNNGVYHPVEAARLLRVHPELITRWTRPTRRSFKGARVSETPVVPPTYGDLLSFLDLICLMVVNELFRRLVPTDALRTAGQWLAAEHKTTHPYAHREVHQQIATLGPSLFAMTSDGNSYDAGRGGQGAFRLIIEPLVRPLEYAKNDLASLWRPHDRVWVNPRVQAGSPCVDGRRVLTQLLVQLVDNGDDPDEIADAYELERSDVDAAVDWERSLAA